METKYNQFLSFDWQNSSEWHTYFNNIFPIPEGSRVEHYKRKFYKLKIDPDFDINYNQPNSSQSNQRQHHVHHNPPVQTISPQMLFETIFELFFLISSFIPYISIKIALFTLITRILISNGMPKWTVAYLNSILFNTEDFHLAIFSLVLNLEETTIISTGPLIIYFIFNMIHNLKKMNFTWYQKYIPLMERVISSKDQYFFYMSLFQLANGLLFIGGIFIGLNSLLYPVIYWQYIKFAYCVSTQLQLTMDFINNQANQLRERQLIPPIVKTIIEKAQSLISYLGTTNPQRAAVICQIF